MNKLNFKNSARKTFSLFILAMVLIPSLLVSAATSLSVTISASPSSGVAPLNNVSLTATVSGDATGLVTYRFDCTSDGSWDWIQSNNNSTYTASNICNYSTAGNYTATVKVERENLAFQGTTAISVENQSIPTVDLKANGSDGPITINYNTAATLSWTSSNASSCYATDTAWQGNKLLSGTESTGSLLSSRTYILTCAGSGGTVSDNVSVLVNNQPQSLYASLEAIPNVGNVPLNNVDLRATATGTATGTITYRFDCTSDGSWDQTFTSVTDNPKLAVDVCHYQNSGTYIAKVRVERGAASPAEATATILVNSGATQDLTITKLARNLSDNTAFGETTVADPGEVIEFRIFVTATGNSSLENLIVKDVLPDKMNYYGGLKIDNVFASGDVLNGLNIGSLSPQQTKTIIFQAVVAPTANFSFGATDLINTALAYNTSVSRTDTAIVSVMKSGVLGATDVPTGVLDSAKIALIISAMATILLTYLMLLKFYVSNKAYALGINEAAYSVRQKMTDLLPKEPSEKAEQRLTRIIEEIKDKEKKNSYS